MAKAATKIKPIEPITAYEPCISVAAAAGCIHWKGSIYLDITKEYVERHFTNYRVATERSYNRFTGETTYFDRLVYMDVVTGLLFNAETGECTTSSKINLKLETLVDDATTKSGLSNILRGMNGFDEEAE
jgi:hypothetical protein